MGLKKWDEAEIKQKEEALEKELIEKENKEQEIVVGDDVITPDDITLETEKTNVTNDEEQLLKEVNEHKAEYEKSYKKAKKMKIINTLIFILPFIGGLIFIFLSNKMKNIGVYIGIALIIVGLIIFYILGSLEKRKLSDSATKYIEKLCETQSKFLFNDSKFSELNVNASYQIPMADFVDCKFYKNIKNTRSRNYATVRYNGRELKSCDMAASILLKNKTNPMFLGKFYQSNCSYDKKDSYIVFQLKGKELSRPIDDVDDLKCIENNKKYCLYSNDEDYKKIFTDKVLSELLRFKIDKTLIDIIFSIRNGVISLGIDYSDDYMSIPVESDYKIENIRRTKLDLERVLKIFDLVNSK